jgi:acetolactate synthase-1/2/3 large subunit
VRSALGRADANPFDGPGVREQGLAVAGQIATKTGARLIAQFTNARMQRGHGCVSVDRMPYVVDQTLRVLAGLKHIVLVGSNMPVAFFAYPDKPSKLFPDDCREHVLAQPDEDQIAALEMLCEAVGARQTLPPIVNEERPHAAFRRDHLRGIGSIDRRAAAIKRDRRRRGTDYRR